MLRILILDDNISATKRLKTIISEMDEAIETVHYTSEDGAYLYAFNNKVDLFLVEINLTNGSGFTFAENIRALKEYEMTFLVFVTLDSKTKGLAFEKIRCYDYFIKPIDEIALKESITKALSYEIKPRDPKISLVLEGTKQEFYLSDILRVDSESKVTRFHLTSGTVFSISSYKYPIKEVLKILTGFIRIHKSHIVNLAYIENVKEGFVYLKGLDAGLKIGRNYVKNVKENWGKVIK